MSSLGQNGDWIGTWVSVDIRLAFLLQDVAWAGAWLRNRVGSGGGKQAS